MKKSENCMKSFLFLLLISFSFPRTAYSYPDSEMNACIASALNNPVLKSISKTSITNYCDCALKATIDENQDISESGSECAKKNFS